MRKTRFSHFALLHWVCLVVLIGNVSIPTTYATTTIGATGIHTTGFLTVDGALKFTSGANNGWVLMSDALGNATWQDLGFAPGDITATDILNWNTAYGWGDHSAVGYLTSYTETDPVYSAWLTAYPNIDLDATNDFSPSDLATDYGFTDNSGNWDTAYSWGDHSMAGYLTSYSETDPFFAASAASSILSGDVTNWNTAYGWGDHSTAGYLTSYTETDPVYSASSWASTTNNATNWDTAYGWGDHSSAGYLTSYTETDPVYSGDPASGIIAGDITNWNTAYGWGNHATAGYLTSYTETDPTIASQTGQNGKFLTTNGSITSWAVPSVTETDPVAGAITGIIASDGAGNFSAVTDNSANWNTAYGWGDHSTAGYLTSYTETDPVYSASSWASTTNNATNWDTAYGWGDHSSAGYLTSESDPNAVLKATFTTAGDVIVGTGAGTYNRLGVGSNGQVLTIFGGVPSWQNAASGFADPLTTRGDLMYRDPTNTTNRLAVGSANQVITTDGTDVSWGGNISNWNTAYGWGDHSTAGYLTSYTETDPVWVAAEPNYGNLGQAETITANWVNTANPWADNEVADTLTIGAGSTIDDGALSANVIMSGDNVSSLNNDAGYLTAETDPVAGAITGIIASDGAGNFSAVTDNSANWNTAYGWGDHSTAGYLTSYSVPADSLDYTEFKDAMAVDADTSTDLGGNDLTFNDTTGGGAFSITTNGAALTLTSNAAATWSTSSGALTVDSAAALNLGTTNATGVNISKTGTTTAIQGLTTLGTATTDYVTFNGYVNSNIVPSASATYSLGSDSNRWQHMYVKGNSLHIGDQGDDVVVGYNLANDAMTLNQPLMLANIDGVATPPASTLNGSIYYDTNSNKFKCYENGGWVNCIGTGSGITSLGGQTGSTQTFANDTNVTISSATNTHTLGWSGQLAESRGGTNQSTYTTGDILYASAADTLSKLGVGTNGQCLTSNGTIPAWGSCGSGSMPSGTTNYTLRYDGANWVQSGYLQNTSSAVQVGLDGTDGSLILYSEQGGTDYTVTFNPNSAMTQSTTYTLPVSYPAANNYLMTSDTSGNLSWNSLSTISAVTSSYGELYENNPTGTSYTITTAGTYYKWTSSTVGDCKGAPYITCTANATDDITVNASGAGLYLVNYSVTFDVDSNNRDVKFALYKEGVQIPESQNDWKATAANNKYVMNGTALVSMTENDSLTLMMTSSSNGDVVKTYNADINVHRIN